jgi:tetratricopeptide (TPR) repeat protein
MAAAEQSLRRGDARGAEARYRATLQEGWLLMAALESAAGRLAESRDALSKATTVAAPTPQALRALAQSLASAGQTAEAVQKLEQARGLAPDDLTLAYDLAAGYLRLKRTEDAAVLFTRILQARPLARTHVLVGRAYHEAGEGERASVEMRAALKLDPSVRWAHYHLGLIAIEEGGVGEIEAASRELQAELKLAPGDAATSVQLGMALVEARRPAEALPALEAATRAPRPESRAFYFLGRCLLALDRPRDALVALRRSLELAEAEKAGEGQLGSVHNQLGVALRTLGSGEEAGAQFAEAERLLARGAETARERMTAYLADAPDPAGGPASPAAAPSSPLAQLPEREHQQLRGRAMAAMTRAYLNLGVMQAQASRFAEAADLFEEAAGLDPDFPQVQYSLGIARFNARQLDKATAPLARAVAADPQNAGLKRMLAMSWLEAREYEKAAGLLRDDPGRERDPAVQYAYGLALSKSGRSAEAAPIFAALLREHADWAELHVVLGKAHAQEGDFPKAIESLDRALGLKPDVAEANATLGVIYLKQGRLADAEAALRAELKAQPGDVQSRQNLAVVLDSEQRPDEAVGLLRGVLASKPDFADARYLLGKILLAQGAVPEAIEHLEAAARLSPEDANIHYQLGQAYQRQGRSELAEAQFEIFRQIKARR